MTGYPEVPSDFTVIMDFKASKSLPQSRCREMRSSGSYSRQPATGRPDQSLIGKKNEEILGFSFVSVFIVLPIGVCYKLRTDNSWTRNELKFCHQDGRSML